MVLLAGSRLSMHGTSHTIITIISLSVLLLLLRLRLKRLGTVKTRFYVSEMS